MQLLVLLLISLAVLGMSIYALIQALRFREDAYRAADRRTKRFWSLLTGLAVLLSFLSVPYPLGSGGTSFLLLIAAAVISGLFLADVLPALRGVMGRAQGRYGRRY